MSFQLIPIGWICHFGFDLDLLLRWFTFKMDDHSVEIGVWGGIRI